MLSACSNPRPTHRCGQCAYCRVLDKLDIVNRLHLEYQLRPNALFITWTYSDEYLPVFSGLANLYKPDLVSAIDRLRNRLLQRGIKITIFSVGEYGGKLFGSPKATRDIHPHYHLAIYSSQKDIMLHIRKAAEEAWFMGHTHILQLSSGLIDYISGYISEKRTNERSMNRIGFFNLRPEFTYRSRRPAIGDISDQLIPIQEEHGKLTHLLINGKQVVMPKYLRFKLKDYFLKWDLDLTTKEGKEEYEKRKYESKIETLSALREKEDQELFEVGQRSLVGDAYSKRSAIKKQIVTNFNFKINKNTKGIKIL